MSSTNIEGHLIVKLFDTLDLESYLCPPIYFIFIFRKSKMLYNLCQKMKLDKCYNVENHSFFR